MRFQRTKIFIDWLTSLRDDAGRAMITRRLKRFADGNPGVVRSVGAGVFEMKIDFGPGYRVYYTQRGRTLILLLCGGDKSSQSKDIERAKRIAAEVKVEEEDD